MEALFPGASEFHPRNDKLHEICESEDAMQLWENVKRLCIVGVVTNADLDKIQRDADFRFSRVHQYSSESLSGFYDRSLQEVGAWTEAGNAFVESQIIIEGNDPDAEPSERGFT